MLAVADLEEDPGVQRNHPFAVFCSLLAYPNVNALLNLALTLPITTCESERSFSQDTILKKMKARNCSELYRCEWRRIKTQETKIKMFPMKMRSNTGMAEKTRCE